MSPFEAAVYFFCLAVYSHAVLYSGILITTDHHQKIVKIHLIVATCIS